MTFRLLPVFILAIIAVWLLQGCERRPPDPVVSVQKKWFTVVDIRLPKHFYVSLREEGTNYVFKDQYVDKNCDDVDKLRVGSRWQFEEVTYQGENSQYSELRNMDSFCDRISRNAHLL